MTTMQVAAGTGPKTRPHTRNEWGDATTTTQLAFTLHPKEARDWTTWPSDSHARERERGEAALTRTLIFFCGQAVNVQSRVTFATPGKFSVKPRSVIFVNTSWYQAGSVEVRAKMLTHFVRDLVGDGGIYKKTGIFQATGAFVLFYTYGWRLARCGVQGLASALTAIVTIRQA